jgi:GH15 family glucan-1,4-alpha-glucosidase
MITVTDAGEIEVDETCDASLWGLFAFGLYSAEDPRIQETMGTLRERLWVKTKVGGMSRYEGDTYYRRAQEVPGNPWFICTLWYADYLIARAEQEEDLQEAIDILSWTAEHALPSGVLAEQVDPLTGSPLSVSPLTWSHATFVASCQHVLRRLQKIDRCPACGLPITPGMRSDDWLEKLYGEACDTIRGICRVK